jgi:hypothetical protein
VSRPDISQGKQRLIQTMDSNTKWPLKSKSTSKIKLVVFLLRTSTVCRNLKITLWRQQRKWTPENILTKQGFEHRNRHSPLTTRSSIHWKIIGWRKPSRNTGLQFFTIRTVCWILKMSDLAVERTKRRGQDRRIKRQPIVPFEKHPKCQDLKKKKKSNKPDSPWPFASARSNIVEVGRGCTDIIPYYHCRHHLVDDIRNHNLVQ